MAWRLPGLVDLVHADCYVIANTFQHHYLSVDRSYDMHAKSQESFSHRVCHRLCMHAKYLRMLQRMHETARNQEQCMHA